MRKMQGDHQRVLGVLVVLSAAGAVALAPQSAAAQDRFYGNIEGGGSAMLNAPQSSQFGLGFYGAARLGVRIAGPLGFHLAIAYDDWAGKTGAIDPNTGTQTQNGSLVDFGAGLRLAPEISRTLGSIFIDVGAGLGTTGAQQLHQLAIDAGIGWLIPAGRWVGIGPVVRYNQVISTGAEVADARFITFGLAVGFPGHSAPPPPPPDTDMDGVIDAQDLCPTVPAGPHPDPNRPGCPIGDRDHDGVTDDVDQCPDVPAGSHPDPQRPGCPIGDRDHDGVTDDVDQCPDVPAGPHPDLQRPGCPIADRDNDGVPDAQDQCPDVPAGPRPDPARPGCPAPAAVVTQNAITINQEVFFAHNRSTILPQSFPILDEVVRAMHEHPEIRRMRVEGNADDTGGPAYNLTLSQQRAHAVMSYLKHHGVERTRLDSVGYGSTRPAVQGDTEEAHARNRRVDFVIVDGPGTTGSTGATSPTEAPTAPHGGRGRGRGHGHGAHVGHPGHGAHPAGGHVAHPHRR